jgi:hypothetical protein
VYRLRTNIEKLEVVLSTPITTNQLEVVTSFTDTPNVVNGSQSQSSVTNDTSYVTITNPPGLNNVREVDTINIVNVDTVNAILFVYYNNNGLRRLLYKVDLDSGDNLEYTSANGWKVTNSTGSVKGVGSIGPTGQGVPIGGNAEEVLTKIDGTNYNTYWRDIDSFIIAMAAAL